MNNNLLANEASNIERKYLRPLNDESLSKCQYAEDVRDRVEGPFQRDYARVMYASSFRRLQGKMQLLGIKNDQFFRNRLTHSLEVAQIARSIACEVKYTASESFVVEAGALAHDLGNPPFGHSGEKVLCNYFKDIGGFEGNAQTLRILKSIEKKKPEFNGLNLTYRTLLSIIKYFNKFDIEKYNKGEHKQKFIYDDDYNFFSEFIEKNKIDIRTLDVQIVDIADEIAYAAHDLEDGLRVKAFTIDEILHDYYIKYGSSESYNKLKEIINKCREKAGYERSTVDSSEYSKLFRQEISSMLIYTLIHDICMIKVDENHVKKTCTKQHEELGFKNYGELALGLKDITFQCINHNDEVYSYETKGKEVLITLCDFYVKNVKYLPPEYRGEYVLNQYKNENVDEEAFQKRLICDYVSGMMDSYAISRFEKFSGKKF